MPDHAVVFENITQLFGSFCALNEVSFAVKKNSLHGLVGENGAGKTTAMHILYGLLNPSRGRLWVDGKAVTWSSPKDSIRAGVGMVHQHFMLAQSATVLENVIVGHEPSCPLLDFLPNALQPARLQPAAEKILELCRTCGFELNLDERIENLSVGEQQRVEILKLLYRDAQLLIFDEPTAVLTPSETAQLLNQLRLLCAMGKTIILISHKLSEILAAADMITVLRQGKVVTTKPACDFSEASLAELMVGKRLQHIHLGSFATPESFSQKFGQQPILELKNVDLESTSQHQIHGGKRQLAEAPKGLDAVSLELHPGEILGVAGVQGNGQSELLRVLTDPTQQKFSGRYTLFGQDASSLSAAQVKKQGLVYIPEDRQKCALLLDSSLLQNFCLGRVLDKNILMFSNWLSIFKLINHNKLATLTEQAVAQYDIRPARTQLPMVSFSGGNQQKLVVARELSSSPKIIVAAQPTRGVDIGAAQIIHTKLIQASLAGAGLLIVSSDLDELIKLSHRILVFYRGRVSGSFARADFDEEKIGLCMGGVEA